MGGRGWRRKQSNTLGIAHRTLEAMDAAEEQTQEVHGRRTWLPPVESPLLATCSCFQVLVEVRLGKAKKWRCWKPGSVWGWQGEKVPGDYMAFPFSCDLKVWSNVIVLILRERTKPISSAVKSLTEIANCRTVECASYPQRELENLGTSTTEMGRNYNGIKDFRQHTGRAVRVYSPLFILPLQGYNAPGWIF